MAKMVALKRQCNLVSIMVPPEASFKESFSQKKGKVYLRLKNLDVSFSSCESLTLQILCQPLDLFLFISIFIEVWAILSAFLVL